MDLTTGWVWQTELELTDNIMVASLDDRKGKNFQLQW